MLDFLIWSVAVIGGRLRLGAGAIGVEMGTEDCPQTLNGFQADPAGVVVYIPLCGDLDKPLLVNPGLRQASLRPAR